MPSSQATLPPEPDEGTPLIKTVDKCRICGAPISTDPRRALCSHQAQPKE